MHRPPISHLCQLNHIDRDRAHADALRQPYRQLSQYLLNLALRLLTFSHNLGKINIHMHLPVLVTTVIAPVTVVSDSENLLRHLTALK